jgi:tetrapyrrole methylase family protein/MazG family protein
MSITIVGLGPGDPGDITRRAWQALTEAQVVYLRTRIHPTVAHLPEGPTYHAFDELYEAADDFAAVYGAIVTRLVEAAGQGAVLYAVPGDPMVAEGTVTRLLAACAERDIPTTVISGVSFIERTLAALKTDALDGLQLHDAISVAAAYHPPLNPDFPALIAQVYGQAVASDLKLTLMNQYPDEHAVTLITAAGTPQQALHAVPLYQIDRLPVDHLTSLWVPPLQTASVTSFEGLQNTMAHLRAPEGCPWDREQDHQTLRKYLIEEAYEVLEAIDEGDPAELASELGDLLLQVVFHAQVAIEAGDFTMSDIIRAIDDKMKRRHPHVWGEVDVKGDAGQVVANWQQIKEQERAERGEAEKSLLDGVPASLPALAQAHAYDRRALNVGFDWPNQEGVLAKIREEIDEILTAQTPDERLAEFGDLLLVMAVWARWLDVDPEHALKQANRKFYRRFTFIERRARQAGRRLEEMTLDEMDALWNEAKAAEIKKRPE